MKIDARSVRRVAVAICTLGVVGSLFTGPAAQAAPVEPLFVRAIDDYSDYQGQTTCVKQVQPGVAAFRAVVLPVYPGTGYGQDIRACDQGGQSEHKDGRAWDWTIPDGHQSDANNLLTWLLAPDTYGNKNAILRRFGIMYIIWNRQIWRAYDPDKGWQDYTGADPHTSHVHFSFGWDGAREQTSWFTGQSQGLRLDQAGIGVAWRDKTQLDLVRRAPNGEVERRTWVGAWGDWENIGGDVDSAPAAVWTSKKSFWVLASGDGALVARRWQSDTGWSDWDSLGSDLTSGVSVTATRGRMDVVGRGENQNVIMRTWKKGSWGDWIDLGGTITAPPAAVWRTPKVLDVFARGASGLYVKTYDESWGGWLALSGSVTSGPAATSMVKGEVDLFARSADGTIETRHFNSDGWSDWLDLGGLHSSAPAADAVPDTRIDVFTRRPDGLIAQDRYFPGSGWLGWVVP